MNRREALKKLGLTFGLVAAGPGFMAACASAEKPADGRYFFTDEQFDLLSSTVDVIIPKTTKYPSASEVGVPEYIDRYIGEVVSLEEQDKIKAYMDVLSKKSASTAVDELVKGALDLEPADQGKMWNQINSYTESVNSGTSGSLSDEAAIFALMYNLRSMTIGAYKNSRKVGEEILVYESVPGHQKGCVDLQETTGGLAWSL